MENPSKICALLDPILKYDELGRPNPGTTKLERFVFCLFLEYRGYQSAEDAAADAIVDAKILLKALEETTQTNE